MADFPLTTYSDNVRAQRLLMEHLGVTKLEAVVGFSMGGQIAYTWGVLYPSECRTLFPHCHLLPEHLTDWTRLLRRFRQQVGMPVHVCPNIYPQFRFSRRSQGRFES